jgi:membrane protease YdiL (CAAX protease family)
VRTSWTIRFAIVALLTVVVLGIIEGLVVSLLVGPGALRIGIAGILFDLTMLGAIGVLYRRRPFRARELGLRPAPVASSVGWVFLSVIVIGITNYLWLQKVLGHKLTHSLGISLHGSTAGLCVAGVFICVLAPVTEEIFFRGLLYRALRNRLPVFTAAVIGGLIFGAVHGLSYPINTLPPRVVFGIIACLLYERTGSLLPGIALHILIDAGGFVAAVGGPNTIVLDVFVAIGALLLLYAFVGALRRPPALSDLTTGGGAPPTVHRTPG